MTIELTRKHINDCILLRECYPFRIIWAAVDNDGNRIQGADINRRQINKMAKLGYKVFEMKEA